MEIEASLSKLSTFCQFFQCPDDMDDAMAQEFSAHLEIITLPQDEVLFHQGDPGDRMYVVVSGALAVLLADGKGLERRIDVLDTGESVGEIALFTGQKRSATVRALTDANLISLSKDGLNQISQKYPDLGKKLIEKMLPRIQRTQLALAVTRLLGPLDAQSLHDLQRKVNWRHLTAGEVLIQQGEVEDTMYLVVNGRLAMESRENEQEPRILGEIERGESVGEFAMVSRHPRSATIFAMRDSDVVGISRQVYEELVAAHPGFLQAITRLIVERSRRIATLPQSGGHSVVTIAVQSLDPAIPLGDLVQQLNDQLSTFGPTLRLDSQRFDDQFGRAGAAQAAPQDPLNYSVTNWLQEQEHQFKFVLYEMDIHPTSWSARSLRQADRVLQVGFGDRPPAALSKGIELAVNRPQRELILIQPSNQSFPQRTDAWLKHGDYRAIHHVRLGNLDDFGRLARRITGRATGLVFSGGGARGFAHVGVIRAIEEAGIPIDMIGGTSMGALIGGALAAGMNSQQIEQVCRVFGSPKKVLDYTLPLSSLVASKKVSHIYQETFGNLQIEDLWTPFFCISTNMTCSEPMIHQSGPLWLAVRASTAIPGIFSPVAYQGDVLVDGGVMNAFPVDIMKSHNQGGPVIGVNCSPKKNKFAGYDFETDFSGWQGLLRKVIPLGKKQRIPSIMTNLMGASEVNGIFRRQQLEEQADILLKPPVSQYESLDFGAYAELVEIGYQYTRERLAEVELPIVPA
jgi:predicted acylesterase/phospholipase RssA/CRP-like cAMP-binding protein